MSQFVEIVDSNGKVKRSRFINPGHVVCVDASGSEHCLLQFTNGKCMEIYLSARKVCEIFNQSGDPAPAPPEEEPAPEFSDTDAAAEAMRPVVHAAEQSVVAGHSNHRPAAAHAGHASQAAHHKK